MRIASSRKGWLRYLALFSALSFLVGCPASKTDTKKGKEVPDVDTQAAKEKEILDLFKDRSADELGGIFLEKGTQTKDDSDGRFVLLRMARDYSAKGGGADDIDHALRAVDELAKSFDIDALEWKRETVAKLVDSVKTPDLNYDLTNESLNLVDGGTGPRHPPQNCVEADRYDIANALLGYAENTCKKAKPVKDLIDEDDLKRLQARLSDCKNKIQEMEKEFENVKGARDTLETKPDDKGANLTWGKYLCAIKGNWDKGLPMLEKSEDKEVAQAVKKDLAKPSSGDDQVKAGDEWWGLAEKEQGMARQQMKKRAVYWYKKAESSVAGLTQERIKKCIHDVEAKD